MSKGFSGLFNNTIGYESQNKVNFYVSPNGKVLEAKYKKWIGVNRRNSLLKKAKSNKLKNAIDQLYRPGSIIGDGGTASVLKFELATGIPLGKNGNFHTQKVMDMIKYLTNKILTDEALSNSDRKLASNLKKKLLKSLGEIKNGK